MRELAARTAPIGESTVSELRRRIVARSQPGFAGIYSQLPRRIAGSPVVFPNPAKIAALMEEFGAWLNAAPPDPATVFEAHFRLTELQPFGDGNGRTARLLMNLLLVRGGYPPLPCGHKTAKPISTRWSVARSPGICGRSRISCMSGWTRPWRSI